jgi:UDP-N-acetylglucosamine 2-epimerase (non-hydrolysing)
VAIYVVIGTKAQLIKMAPVLKEMEKRNIGYIYIDPGQHSSTTSKFRELFGIGSPDVILYHSPRDVTGLLQALRWSMIVLSQALLKRKAFDGDGIFLTHGDALSGLYGAIMAKIAGCKVAHVEAGERTHNWWKPFPEEVVRVIVDRWSDLSFAMSHTAYQHLLEERVGGKVVNVRRNSLCDAVRWALRQRVDLDLPPRYALVSMHRLETILSRERMEIVVTTLEKVVKELEVVFSLHEPTKERLSKYGLLKRLEAIPQVHLRPLFDYFSFVHAMRDAEFLITDGGGPQEESYYLGIPCLLMRTETERAFHPNVFVSNFVEERVEQFLATHQALRRAEEIEEFSPSALIVDEIERWA